MRDLAFMDLLQNRRVPFVVRLLGGRFHIVLRALPRLLRGQVVRRMRGATAVLAETEEQCRYLSGELGNAVDVRWIPNHLSGADVNDLRGWRPPKDCVNIAFVGAMCEEKGVGRILEVASALRADPRLRFHLIGSELAEGYVETLRARASQLGIDGRVRFHGALDRRGVGRCLAEAHLFLFPSTWKGEGQPGALIEAMCAGAVPIAYDWRGVSEVVTHGWDGWLAPPGDIVALTDGVRMLADDWRRLAGMSERAQRTARERFGERAAWSVYQEVLPAGALPGSAGRTELPSPWRTS